MIRSQDGHSGFIAGLSQSHKEIPYIGTEAAQFPENEHINGIFVSVHRDSHIMII